MDDESVLSGLAGRINMFPVSAEWFRKKKEQTANLPHREVSEEEFVRLFMETNGVTEERAKTHVTLSRGLGSFVHIGQEMLKVKEDE